MEGWRGAGLNGELKMLSTLEHLKRVREILALPEHWTQGNYGTRVPVRLAPGQLSQANLAVPIPLASCFCLHGAWAKVAMENGEGFQAAINHFPLQVALGDCVPGEAVPDFDNDGNPVVVPSVVDFNDAPGRTHEEILEVLDCAIKKHAGD